MTDNADNTVQVEQSEQITKAPSNVSKREKDPKRVAAGKKLAASNKQMREEYAKYKALEAQRESAAPAGSPAGSPAETETEGDGNGWFPELSLTNVISLVGIGLTVYNIFSRYKDDKPTNEEQEKHVAWREPVHTVYETPQPEPKSKPQPRFGM